VRVEATVSPQVCVPSRRRILEAKFPDKGGKTMRRILMSLATLALTAGALGFAGAGTANATGPCDGDGPGSDQGNFFAFRANNYEGRLISVNIDPSDGDVNVLDNATNSVINHTPYVVCGVNDGTPGDQTIISIPPAPADGSHRTSIGSDFNKIDWFYARTTGQGCDD
jgi:hypothetical protein